MTTEEIKAKLEALATQYAQIRTEKEKEFKNVSSVANNLDIDPCADPDDSDWYKDATPAYKAFMEIYSGEYNFRKNPKGGIGYKAIFTPQYIQDAYTRMQTAYQNVKNAGAIVEPKNQEWIDKLKQTIQESPNRAKDVSKQLAAAEQKAAQRANIRYQNEVADMQKRLLEVKADFQQALAQAKEDEKKQVAGNLYQNVLADDVFHIEKLVATYLGECGCGTPNPRQIQYYQAMFADMQARILQKRNKAAKQNSLSKEEDDKIKQLSTALDAALQNLYANCEWKFSLTNSNNDNPPPTEDPLITYVRTNFPSIQTTINTPNDCEALQQALNQLSQDLEQLARQGGYYLRVRGVNNKSSATEQQIATAWQQLLALKTNLESLTQACFINRINNTPLGNTGLFNLNAIFNINVGTLADLTNQNQVTQICNIFAQRAAATLTPTQTLNLILIVNTNLQQSGNWNDANTASPLGLTFGQLADQRGQTVQALLQAALQARGISNVIITIQRGAINQDTSVNMQYTILP